MHLVGCGSLSLFPVNHLSLEGIPAWCSFPTCLTKYPPALVPAAGLHSPSTLLSLSPPLSMHDRLVPVARLVSPAAQWGECVCVKWGRERGEGVLCLPDSRCCQLTSQSQAPRGTGQSWGWLGVLESRNGTY